MSSRGSIHINISLAVEKVKNDIWQERTCHCISVITGTARVLKKAVARLEGKWRRVNLV
jgi:hypothetical protein